MEKVKTPTTRYVISTLVTLLIMSLFAFVLITVYLPNRVKNVNEDIIKERLAKLAAVNAKQAEAISSYSWVDKEKGIVKIPITEAMKLVVARPNDIQFTKPAEVQKPAETTKSPEEKTTSTETQKVK